MKLFNFLLYLLLLLQAYHYTDADVITGRETSACAFLSNKIYCYGGYIKDSTSDDVLYSLDIFANNGSSIQNLNSAWSVVTPNNPDDISLGRRPHAQAVAMPDGIRLLINGGYNYISGPNPQQHIAYNSESNTWEVLVNYFDPVNGGNRQIYDASAFSIPSQGVIGFYGGQQQHVAAPINGVPVTTYKSSDEVYSSISGYSNMTLYNIASKSWSLANQMSVPDRYASMFSTVLYPPTNKLYFLGGLLYNLQIQEFPEALNYTTTFDTNTGQWGKESIAGKPPSPRYTHTATLLPNGQDVFVYGGSKDGKNALEDYSHIFNIPTMTWKQFNLVAPSGAFGPRAGHSAILVNNATLFILFGMSVNGQFLNDVMALDVRDVDNITFIDSFPNSSSESSNSVNTTGHTTSKGLSVGAIVGIALGGAAAIAFLLSMLLCLSGRKKKSEEEKAGDSSVNYNQPKNRDHEVMEVDWDSVDNHFRDTTMFPLQYQENGHSVSSVNNRVSSNSYPRFSMSSSEQQTVVSQGFDLKPDGYTQYDVPHTRSTNLINKPLGDIPSPKLQAVKPDGAGLA